MGSVVFLIFHCVIYMRKNFWKREQVETSSRFRVWMASVNISPTKWPNHISSTEWLFCIICINPRCGSSWVFLFFFLFFLFYLFLYSSPHLCFFLLFSFSFVFSFSVSHFFFLPFFHPVFFLSLYFLSLNFISLWDFGFRQFYSSL